MILDQLPSLNEKRIAVHVKPEVERAIRDGHPWVFDNSITRLSHEGAAGDLAVLFNRKRKFLALGLYDPESAIRVKVIHVGKPIQVDAAFWQKKIEQAAKLRAVFDPEQTNGFRLIHGENDGFAGLVVDAYEDTLVLKLYSTAWLPHLKLILESLNKVVPNVRVVLRLGRAVEKACEAFGLVDGMVISGEKVERPILFRENGILFEADVLRGHKTGFYFDQRDNRARVEQLARKRRVLNVFAYTGGFSLYAARGGAHSVYSIDASAPALEAAERNFKRNRGHLAIGNCQHETILGDAFDVLNDLQGQEYDLVVIDPPSFAQSQRDIPNARKAYTPLVKMGVNLVRPSGKLVMARCSSRITEDDFVYTVTRAGRLGKRPININKVTSHAIDHPINFKEGAYLKCIFATVP